MIPAAFRTFTFGYWRGWTREEPLAEGSPVPKGDNVGRFDSSPADGRRGESTTVSSSADDTARNSSIVPPIQSRPISSLESVSSVSSQEDETYTFPATITDNEGSHIDFMALYNASSPNNYMSQTFAILLKLPVNKNPLPHVIAHWSSQSLGRYDEVTSFSIAEKGSFKVLFGREERKNIPRDNDVRFRNWHPISFRQGIMDGKLYQVVQPTPHNPSSDDAWCGPTLAEVEARLQHTDQRRSTQEAQSNLAPKAQDSRSIQFTADGREDAPFMLKKYLGELGPATEVLDKHEALSRQHEGSVSPLLTAQKTTLNKPKKKKKKKKKGSVESASREAVLETWSPWTWSEDQQGYFRRRKNLDDSVRYEFSHGPSPPSEGTNGVPSIPRIVENEQNRIGLSPTMLKGHDLLSSSASDGRRPDFVHTPRIHILQDNEQSEPQISDSVSNVGGKESALENYVISQTLSNYGFAPSINYGSGGNKAQIPRASGSAMPSVNSFDEHGNVSYSSDRVNRNGSFAFEAQQPIVYSMENENGTGLGSVETPTGISGLDMHDANDPNIESPQRKNRRRRQKK